jgi:hypothetical protein
MDNQTVERIFTIGIKVGVINLAKELGLIDELITEKQAYAKYTKELVDELRIDGWIVAYPSGNSIRSKFYYKRSELETARQMHAIKNIIDVTKIDQLLEKLNNENIKAKEQTNATKLKPSRTRPVASARISKNER